MWPPWGCASGKESFFFFPFQVAKGGECGGSQSGAFTKPVLQQLQLQRWPGGSREATSPRKWTRVFPIFRLRDVTLFQVSVCQIERLAHSLVGDGLRATKHGRGTVRGREQVSAAARFFLMISSSNFQPFSSQGTLTVC